MNGELKAAIEKHNQDINGCILMGYVGSIAHGTYVPQSNPNSIDDRDVMGIVIPSADHIIGLGSWEGKQFMEGCWDVTLYSLAKFIKLLLKCNPNVLGLLWLEKNGYLLKTWVGQLLIDRRDIFVSKQAYHAFSGYAHGQLKRMTHLAYEGYMGAKRKALVQKHGYDTKNAAHLIRILRMGIEFLVEGKLYVLRSDSQELLQIKAGAYSLEKVNRMADKLFEDARTAYMESNLPAEPNRDAANKLLKQITWDVLATRIREAGR